MLVSERLDVSRGYMERDMRKTNIDFDSDWRDIPANEWNCKWLKCTWGTGLAGMDSCPGNPKDPDCPKFITTAQYEKQQRELAQNETTRNDD